MRRVSLSVNRSATATCSFYLLSILKLKLISMELCYSSAASSLTFLQFKPCSHLLSPNSTCLSLSNSRKPFPSTKLSSLSSPKLCLLPRTSSSPIPPCAAISTSSAAVVEPDIEPLPADIDVKETPEPNSRVRLSVEVPPVVCEDSYKRVLREFTKQAKVPGFRPGKKVPENILVSYVGKASVQKATIESILKRTLPHVMASVTGRALKDSISIATKFPDMEKTYSSSKFLRYEVIVDVAPVVKWVPDDAYKNLKVTVEIDNEIDAQTAFEQELRHRHKSLSSLRIAIDRGLQIGDVAVLDISATTIEKDDSAPQSIPSAETKGFQFDSKDNDRILPGFLESIIGIKAGETKSFNLVFPDSWKQENLHGVEAQFTVECKELFYRVFPELDDAIADKLLPGCTTIEQVKETLLQKCQEMEQTAKEQAADNVILYQLQKMVEVDIPPSLFEEQGRQLYGAKLLEIQSNMKISEQQLASLSSPNAVNEFLDKNQENITNLIKQRLAIGDIFKRENLEVQTEELVKEVENSIAEFKNHKQEYDEESVQEQVQDVLEGAKVLEWLRQNAEIQYKTG